MVHTSCSSDVIDVSCKKETAVSISSLCYVGVSNVYYDSTFNLLLILLTPRIYLRTYNIVHGGLIAAAQMRAVEADHNQTAVEGLWEAEMKAARLILGQISCHRDECYIISRFHKIIKNQYLDR